MKSISVLFLILFVIEALSSPYFGYSPQWTLESNQADPKPLFNPMTDIQYHLFTRENPVNSQIITRDINSVLASHWDPENGVRFIIHGHNSGASAQLNIRIRDELLANADLNVVVVDWSAGSNTAIFANARNRVATTGVAIATFIDDLHRFGLLQFSRINIVGHNLGAHVAGNIGKSVTRGRIQAIFSLDAAANGFSSGDADRLAVTDAVYTEGIHTNAGSNGFSEPITAAAFYPNWGSSQPGCGIDISGNCAHERAFLLYAESINSNRFVARQCSGYQQIISRNCPGIGSGVMGGDAAKNLNGVFYLETNSVAPFARG